MAEVYDKIIQDGVTSFVPRSQKTRAFWTKYNANIARSQNASRETVTIVPATDAENAELNAAAAPVAKAVAPVQASNDIEVLKAQLAQQQQLIQTLLGTLAPKVEPTTPDTDVKEKAKPGPKPKTDTDGKSE